MARWGMAIDLEKCIGCYSCVIACKMKNGTPKGVFFTKVLEEEKGEFPNARRQFLPVLCNHCENPVCMHVCPTGATWQRADGIVQVNAEECIGCRYCMVACPYDARTYIDVVDTYFPAGATPFEQKKYAKWQPGTVTKCDFCVDRVDQGLMPACVVTCPTEARVFGDLEDPDSAINKARRRGSEKQLLPEYGTQPRVFYIE